ncbi:L-type lectin-domain containing protein [Alteromonas gracilis]|uniref:L-type lectin-domain containing protein n=1 Tax=Alteromonas gracilis TaxID=1479524 RepID=UPI002FE292D2
MSLDVSATVISYSDFSDSSGLQFNYDATSNGSAIELSSGRYSSGSVFTSDTQSLNSNVSFSSFFSFVINNPLGWTDTDGIQGGDGLVFVLQTVSSTEGLPSGGGGLGYRNIQQSLGVEFDTWNNGTVDGNNGNHIGINTDGRINSIARSNESSSFNNGSEYFVWVDYDGSNDVLSVAFNTIANKPTVANLSLNIDLTTTFSGTEVYAGFTASSGGAGNTHTLTSFAFSSEYDTNFAARGIEVSEPGVTSLLVLVSCIFAASAARRKSRKL